MEVLDESCNGAGLVITQVKPPDFRVYNEDKVTISIIDTYPGYDLANHTSYLGKIDIRDIYRTIP